MCTVSFVPLKGYHFVLTSNRDEAVNRSEVFFPSSLQGNGLEVIFPKDSLAGGTWIATSADTTACLLNGAFEKHERKLPYRISRGLMLLSVFQYPDVYAFVEQFDFKGIEPFTLVLVYKKEDVLLFEIRWDGERIYMKELASHRAHIWASCTLYSKEVIHQRKQAFQLFMSNFGYTQEEIISFHSFENQDAENGIMMNRGDKRTVSISSVLSTEEGVSMYYRDFISGVVAIEPAGK